MLAILLVLLCAVLRVIPHPPNFAPVGATAVFAGRTLPVPAAIAVTLGAMLLSNLALSALHGWALFTIVTPFVWGALAGQALLGRALRGRRGGAIAASLAGSTLFYVVSNLGVWIAGGYGHTAAGLVACYVAAIPFFGATLASDLLWTVALSLGFRPLARRMERRGSRWVPVSPSATAPL